MSLVKYRPSVVQVVAADRLSFDHRQEWLLSMPRLDPPSLLRCPPRVAYHC